MTFIRRYEEALVYTYLFIVCLYIRLYVQAQSSRKVQSITLSPSLNPPRSISQQHDDNTAIKGPPPGPVRRQDPAPSPNAFRGIGLSKGGGKLQPHARGNPEAPSQLASTHQDSQGQLGSPVDLVRSVWLSNPNVLTIQTQTAELTRLQVGDNDSTPVNIVVSTLMEAESVLPLLREYQQRGRQVNVRLPLSGDASLLFIPSRRRSSHSLRVSFLFRALYYASVLC